MYCRRRNFDATRQETCIPYDQPLAYVQNRQRLCELAHTIRKQMFDDILIVRIRKSHCNEVSALTQNRLVHICRTLAYNHQSHTMFSSFFGDPFKGLQPSLFHRSLRVVWNVQMRLITKQSYRMPPFHIRPLLQTKNQPRYKSCYERQDIGGDLGEINNLQPLPAMYSNQRLGQPVKPFISPQRNIPIEHKVQSLVCPLASEPLKESCQLPI